MLSLRLLLWARLLVCCSKGTLIHFPEGARLPRLISKHSSMLLRRVYHFHLGEHQGGQGFLYGLCEGFTHGPLTWIQALKGDDHLRVTSSLLPCLRCHQPKQMGFLLSSKDTRKRSAFTGFEIKPRVYIIAKPGVLLGTAQKVPFSRRKGPSLSWLQVCMSCAITVFVGLCRRPRLFSDEEPCQPVLASWMKPCLHANLKLEQITGLEPSRPLASMAAQHPANPGESETGIQKSPETVD